MPKHDKISNKSDDAFTSLPNHFLSNPTIQSIHRGHYWKPPTDVYETEENFIISVEIAGMKVEDFVIQFQRQSLVIQGKRNIEFEKCALHQIEINSGEFQVCIDSVASFDKEISNIDYQNGFLTVSLLKLKNKK